MLTLLALLCAGCGDATMGEGAAPDGSAEDDAAAEAAPADAALSDASEAGLPGDGGAVVEGGEDARPAGVPRHHRPAGSECPQVRAPETLKSPCSDGGDPSQCMPGGCREDSDCDAGVNGRCGGLEGPHVGPLVCTYDQCFDDSQCGDKPCECRPSASSSAPNVCYAQSGCTVDSDCGQGGYCSPSLVGHEFCTCPVAELCSDAGGGPCSMSDAGGPPPEVACACGNACAAPGFYCHTPGDTCVNDSDCSGGQSCLFDILSRRWECLVPTCT